MSTALHFFLLLSLISPLTVECRQRRQDWGLANGWTWGNWHYYWYWRHGLRATASDKDTICQRLWNVDVNRFHRGVEYDVSPQTKISQVSNQDNASLPLFNYIKWDLMRSKPTFRAFEEILFNFEPSPERDAVVKTDKFQTRDKANKFLKEILKTRVFYELYWFLVRNSLVSANKTKFEQNLFQIWFNKNNASQNQLSGFQRIFVGETVFNPDKISFRNWIQFYSLELKRLNYYGYLSFMKSNPMIISPKFSWKGGPPLSDNMFVGTSPEFELALYTLCFYTSPDKLCECKLNTRKIIVKTLPSVDGLYLNNAFFEIKK